MSESANITGSNTGNSIDIMLNKKLSFKDQILLKSKAYSGYSKSITSDISKPIKNESPIGNESQINYELDIGYEPHIQNKSAELNINSGKLRNLLKFLGPAFIVSVAYTDPPMYVLEQMTAC